MTFRRGNANDSYSHGTMENITTEQLIAQYQATLKAYQTKVDLIQSGQVLQIGDVSVAKPGSIPSRISVRRR